MYYVPPKPRPKIRRIDGIYRKPKQLNWTPTNWITTLTPTHISTDSTGMTYYEVYKGE